jgi:hypothetical protein
VADAGREEGRLRWLSTVAPCFGRFWRPRHCFVRRALGKIDSNVPFMLPERRARRDANTAITDLIGSGLFRFKREEWIPGAKVVYERFEGSVPRSEPARQG